MTFNNNNKKKKTEVYCRGLLSNASCRAIFAFEWTFSKTHIYFC